METETSGPCVKNATASQLPTTTDVAIKFIIEKNVIRVLESRTLRPLQHQHGNEQVTTKRNHVRCVASLHCILINWMCITLMPT